MNELCYIQKSENGDLIISSVVLLNSDFSIKWFIDFLNGNKEILEYEGHKKYQIRKDSLNNYFLKETRKGNFFNEISFSEEEIPNILERINSLFSE